MKVCGRMARCGAAVALGLFLAWPAFAEGSDRKVEDKDKDVSDRLMEAEANLPIYHLPVKSLISRNIGRRQDETQLTPLRQSRTKPSLAGTQHAPSLTRKVERESGKPATLSFEHSKVLTNVDSLARTQDKERQRALFGIKVEQNQEVPASQPALSESEKVASPAVAPAPQPNINKAPVLQNNATIWTRNDSVPHRGTGTSSLGGPANIRNIGISGTDVKIRP